MDQSRSITATFYAVYYVDDANGSDAATGISWAFAKKTVQAALNLTYDGDTVVVSNGVYDSNSLSVDGMPTRMAVTNDVTIYSVNGADVTYISGDVEVRGVYLADGAELTGFCITGATISEQGGGVYALGSASIDSCKISGNSANNGGGVYGGRVVNCIISDNTASNGGGAAFADLIFCTLIDNTATVQGGGMYNSTGINTIVYYNAPDNTAMADLSYSCITPDPGGTRNITNHPGFINYAGGDYRLAYTSCCINAGTDAAVALDYLGTPRPQPKYYGGAAGYDIGAYEYFALARFVWTNGKHISPYETWTDAATNIQSALNVSVGGDLIIVQDGVYQSASVSNAIMMQSFNGAVGAVIDGRGSNRALSVTTAAIIDGFTIRNGSATDCGGVLADNGATIINCVIVDNEATGGYGTGGGLCLFNGSMATNCLIITNRGEYGSGVYASTSTVRDCSIAANTGTNGYGGGIYITDNSLVEWCDMTLNSNRYGGGAYLGTGTLNNSWIKNNEAANGAGLYVEEGFAHSLLLVNNTAWGHGGGVYISTTSSLFNLTVADNTAITDGGGIYLSGNGRVWNTISYFNTASGSGDNIYTNGSADIKYCNINPLQPGAGNINGDPLFVSLTNYHLTAYSPGLDAGSNQPWMATAVDIDNQVRAWREEADTNGVYYLYTDRVDMGADEAVIEAAAISKPYNFEIDWNVVVDASLQFQTATNLIGYDWVDVGNTVTAQEAVLTIPYTNGNESMRFFRLHWIR